MSTFLRIAIGLGLAAIGAFFVIRTRTFQDFFGPVPVAEKYLGGGGTNLFYKLLGIVLCLIGFIVATNLWDAFLNATVGSVLPRPAEVESREGGVRDYSE